VLLSQSIAAVIMQTLPVATLTRQCTYNVTFRRVRKPLLQWKSD